MDVLSIGNSFSCDAQRYLHRIAKSDGFSLNSFNLYIGGCSLYTHFVNMQSEQRAYTLEMNGESTGFKVSLKEALLNREWDIITIQQVSTKSVNYETYQPYLDEIVSYARKMSPKSKLALHQTWAYEQGSERMERHFGHTNQKQMFNELKKSYDMAAADIKADFVIPSGELFQNLISCGAIKLHRDTAHASLGLGRYALGLLWYKILSGNNVSDNSFSDFDEEITPRELQIVKECVNQF